LKTISKGLILALVIQFALILPFVNIIGVKKAKAEGPVTPSDYSLTLKATDTLYGTIRMAAVDTTGNTVKEFVFTLHQGLRTRNFLGGRSNIPSINYNGSNRQATDEDVIKAYKLSSPSDLRCQAGATVDNIYAIAVLYDNTDGQHHFAGIFSSSSTTPASGEENRFYNKIPNASFGWGGMCNNIHNSDPVAEAVIKRANSNDYNGWKVDLQISDGDRVTRCNSLERRWLNFQSNIRTLMIPAPSNTAAPVGGTANPYWIQSTSINIRWLDLAKGITRIFPDAYAYDSTLDFDLTNEGKRIYDETASIVEQIGNDLTILRNAYPGDSWPNGCVELKEFRWVEGTNDRNYTSLDQFNTDYQQVYELFKQYIENRDEPISTGDTDACGSAGSGMINGKIFQWLFCELANIIHGIAASIMTRATGWLTDSIGVDINIKFKDPETDEVPTGGGGADTPTPGTGTPTPAPRTAAPMNISGTINFLNRSEFDRAKNGGMSVKVKNGQASGPEINVTNEMQWGNWNESEGKGSVSCRFTTTENIPADWTVVTIFGKRGDTVVMRIMTQYPPDPAAFVISNTFAN